MTDNDVLISNLYAFLNAIYTLKVACSHDIQRKTGISGASIIRIRKIAFMGGLIENFGGDNRKRNLRLSMDGRIMLRLLRKILFRFPQDF